LPGTRRDAELFRLDAIRQFTAIPDGRVLHTASVSAT